MNRHSRFPDLVLLSMLLASLIASPVPLMGQDESPVVVDDSPWAWQLLQQVHGHKQGNATEAARLCQRLLDEYGPRLVPRDTGGSDDLVSVRANVMELLLENEELLRTYRRMNRSAASRLMDQGRHHEVVQRYYLTRYGLEALLRITQDHVDSGRFDNALACVLLLDRHPDLDGRRRAHALHMEAISRLGRGEPIDTIRNELGRLDSEESAHLLEHIAMMEACEWPPGPGTSISSLVASGSASLPKDDDGWHRIWSRPLESTLYRRIFYRDESSTPFSPRTVQKALEDASIMTTVPVVTDSTVYINEGHVITALDRINQRVAWQRVFEPTRLDRDGGRVGDLNDIVIHGDRLLTMTGHAGSQARSGGGTILCLDARDGQSLWQTHLDRLDGRDEFEGLFCYGTPVVVDDRVCFLARKVNNRLETVVYAIGLDLQTGELEWDTLVCSCGGVRLSGMRPFSSLRADEGHLYLSSSVGALACINASDGVIRWLHRFPVPIRESRFAVEPWEISSPLMTSRGVLAITPDQSEIVLVEPNSGDILERYPTGLGTNWQMPRYLVQFDLPRPDGMTAETVLAVGHDVSAFDVHHLEKPLWTFSRNNPERIRQLVGGDQRSGIRGRVQPAGGYVVVPGTDGLLIVDSSNGMILQSVDVDEPCNPVLDGFQLLLAGQNQLLSLMPLEEAERLMRSRIDQSPQDPEQALALLQLGLNAGDGSLCLEAAELGIDSIELMGPTDHESVLRGELLQLLLRVDDASLCSQRRSGDHLHSIISAVATQPSQHVLAQLARSAWLERTDRIDEAVMVLQELLSNRDRSTSLIANPDGRIVPASKLALLRLNEIIDVHGSVVTSPLDTQDSVEASVEIAGIMEQEGRSREALLALVRSSWDSTIDHVHTCKALPLQHAGAMATRNQWLDLASELQEHALAIGTELSGQTMSNGTEAVNTPMLGQEPGAVRELDVMLARTLVDDPGEGVLVVSRNELVMLEEADLEPRWAVPLEDTDPLILDSDRFITIQEEGGSGIAISRLDPADGTQVWRTPELSEYFPGDRLEAFGRIAEIPLPGGAPLVLDEIISMVRDDHLWLTRRNGDVAMFDMAGSRQAQWVRSELIDHVHFVEGNELGIVIAGTDVTRFSGMPNTINPRIIVLDPLTGDTIIDHHPELEGDLQWLAISPMGMLALGSSGGVETIGMARSGGGPGPLLWRSASRPYRDLASGWFWGLDLQMADADGAVTTARASDGVLVRDRYKQPGEGLSTSGPLRTVRIDNQGLLLHFKGRVLDFGPRGRLQGTDAVATSPNYTLMLPAGEQIILLSALGSRQIRLQDRLGHRTIFEYRVHQLDRSRGCKLLGPDLQLQSPVRIGRGAVVNGWLLLGSDAGTTAVPLPPGT